MKLALDPQMFYSSSSVYELPDIVASLGYDWMELSPKADFVPFFKYPRVDDAGVKRLKKIAGDAGVGHRLGAARCCAGPVRTKISGRPPYAPGSGPSRSPSIWASR